MVMFSHAAFAGEPIVIYLVGDSTTTAAIPIVIGSNLTASG
jgi:hypothetical protein